MSWSTNYRWKTEIDKLSEKQILWPHTAPDCYWEPSHVASAALDDKGEIVICDGYLLTYHITYKYTSHVSE